jgi:hypothetical protein
MQDIKTLLTRMAMYVILIALSLTMIYIASSSWSAEALFLHPLLMPLYFVVTTFLLLVIVSGVKCSLSDKLALVITHSFLTRLVAIIFFYPGTSGDNAYHLAHETTFYKFGQYYAALEFQIPGLSVTHLQSVISRLFLFQRASIQYGLVTALSKILSIDVFWIHLSLIGILWSIFVPIIGFKISKTLGTGNRVALLAGVLAANAPLIVGWSHVSVPNTLGFMFFFVAIYFLLKWLSSKSTRKYFVLTLLASVVSLLTHPLPGIAAFMLVLLAFIVKRYYNLTKNRTTAAWFLAFGFLGSVMLLPAASFLMQLIYPTYAQYSLQKILGMDIQQIVLANYASYSTIENLMYGTITFLGIIGMILHSRQGKHGYSKILRLFMILAFILIIAEYRIHQYFATVELFGTGRFLVFEPFITVPFAAMALEYLVTNAKPATSVSPNPNPSRKHGILSRFKFPSKQALVIILICLGLSALIVEGVLTDFQGLGFRREPYGILSVYSIEAATLIHEKYLETGEKYVVLSDAVSETAGMAVVGRSNPNEFYAFRPLNYGLLDKMLRDLTIQPLLSAKLYNDASLVYVVVSRFYIRRILGLKTDVDKILTSLSRLLGPPIAIVGEGDRQVHVFCFRAERTQGTGPSVTVHKDSQKAELNTSYSYWTLESVEYTLNLTGGTTYNITEWPKHWSYELIHPSPINVSIDANVWINFTGQSDVTYTIEWLANDFYSDVLWKDDSFLEGWEFHNARGNYFFSSDGDVATLTIAGSPGGFVYYSKQLPTLLGSLSLQMRVKGEPNSQFYVLLFNTTEGVSQIAFNSRRKTPSLDYETYTFELPTNVTLSEIWIAAYTADGTSSVIYWDYVMFTPT